MYKNHVTCLVCALYDVGTYITSIKYLLRKLQTVSKCTKSPSNSRIASSGQQYIIQKYLQSKKSHRNNLDSNIELSLPLPLLGIVQLPKD